MLRKEYEGCKRLIRVYGFDPDEFPHAAETLAMGGRLLDIGVARLFFLNFKTVNEI
jgi:hypothetical protein